MCDFKTNTLDSSPLDPRKRVRYTTGLVMGVDEFQQDQFYLVERDHLHQRSLHGYGVVSGLGIETRQNGQGRWEVVVAPGFAVTPRGQSVCVDESQCANLDDWLDRHRDELLGSPPLVDPFASPPEPLPLWVVLCPRDCETDPVPVLGDPCRTEEDATVPSRIADDFELKLSLEPPEQLEEEAVQRFGDLLRSFVIAESASPFLDQTAVEDLVRGLLPGSPPLPPPASPPEPLYLPADQAAEILTAAWRVWVTEVRPQLAGGAEGCAGGGESCVALGRLDVIVQDNDGFLQTVSADADVTERPFLLHTRVIQEWLTLALRPPRHGDLLGLDDDDHLQYLLVDPTDRALIADLNADGHRVVGLPAAQANGQAVPYEQAVKSGDAAGGDLAGKYRNPEVVRLRGRVLSTATPGNGNLLVWTGAAWTPQGGTPKAGDVLVWDSSISAWVPKPQSGSGAAPDVIEEDLTRILAASWLHGGGHDLMLSHGGALIPALALSFGKGEIALEAGVDPRTLVKEVFRVWARFPDETGFFWRHLEVPLEVVPSQVSEMQDGVILGTEPADASLLTTAVTLVLDPSAVDVMLGVPDLLVRIEVLGDHILDIDGRAIDAELIRSTFPTGGGFQFGIQGGCFESWFVVGGTEGFGAGARGGFGDVTILRGTSASIGDVDLNRATAKDLQTLEGVGPALAKRIVAERKEGGEFTSLEDLRRVSGISDNLIGRLRKQRDGES